ncbi:uncharacterized protein UDID_05314 [Ustilago sp. UG-2017a]|nr:uncharacterized protein UDID_05314 [Ustilago sp. UG-2017a]
MPLSHHAAARSPDSYSQSGAPRSRRTNGHNSEIASSSRLTPSRQKPRRKPDSRSPNGSGRATLGDLLSPATINKSARAARPVIELLDSSDSEPPSPSKQHYRQDTDELDLDDVVTPELPPADASAPTLPESFDHLPGTRQMLTMQAVIHDSPDEEDAEMQLHLAPSELPVATPEPPPDPLANQRPIFDPKELEMQPLYDELKALLDTGQQSDSGDDDEDYEERRQRKLRANAALLDQLGLSATGTKTKADELPVQDVEDQDDHQADDQPTQTLDTPSRGRGRPKKRTRDDSVRPFNEAADKKNKYNRKVKFADDGTTKSAPNPGQVFDLAYVDVPTLRDRARNDYIFVRDVPDIRPEDLMTWSEDEEEAEEDQVQVLDDDDDIFRGYDSLGRLKTKRKKRQPDVLPDGTVMTSCHQCRRKTPSRKVRCVRFRQGVECGLMYCQRCIEARYGMDFNADDPKFHCPRCLGYCSCSVCLRRSGFGDLVHKGKQRRLAFTGELRKLASQDQDGLESLQGRIGAILAETAALKMDEPSPKPCKSNGRSVKRTPKDPDAVAFGPPKRRGRPPKKRHPAEEMLRLNLSDEVTEGQVLSSLDEYALGQLAVARRVLKLVAAKRTAMPRRRLVLKLKIPARAPSCTQAPAALASAVREARRMPNYHDMEKDVWVRGAADYSTSESELEELQEDGTDDGDAQDDAADAVFEEGRTQVFAASLLQQKDHSVSSTVSRDSSLLTSLDDEKSSSSDPSSPYGGDKDVSLQTDEAEEAESSTQNPLSSAMFPSTSLAMSQDLRQLALAVMEGHDESTKGLHANHLRLQLEELPAFATSSGSEAGQLGTLMDAETLAGTPVLFAADGTYTDT